jgi:hypothetical protein
MNHSIVGPVLRLSPRKQLAVAIEDNCVGVEHLGKRWAESKEKKKAQSKSWHRFCPRRSGPALQDLDATFVFLAAESSRYLTSQTLLADGGFSTGAIRVLVEKSNAFVACSPQQESYGPER